MKSQVLHTVWCYISGEAAGEIWTWSLLGAEKGLTCAQLCWHGTGNMYLTLLPSPCSNSCIDVPARARAVGSGDWCRGFDTQFGGRCSAGGVWSLHDQFRSSIQRGDSFSFPAHRLHGARLTNRKYVRPQAGESGESSGLPRDSRRGAVHAPAASEHVTAQGSLPGHRSRLAPFSTPRDCSHVICWSKVCAYSSRRALHVTAFVLKRIALQQCIYSSTWFKF